MITTSLNESLADAFKQPVAVLLPGDQLVDIADGAQHQIEVIYPHLRPLALADVPHNALGGDAPFVVDV
ncbi:MAG: hypothetical protein DDT24_00428 [Chloroflexi bacterium]|nr:hypothetical protein [Chloroflexota bacterium]